MRRCERCNRENPVGSAFCNSCGARLTRPEDDAEPRRKGAEEQVCPRCGMVVPWFRDSCPNCLTQLKQVAPAQAMTRPCPECGRPMTTEGANACIECIFSEQLSRAEVEPRASGDRPITIGILLCAASALAMISTIGLIWTSGHAPTIPYLDISGFLVCCGAVTGFASLACLLGGILSFKRSNFSLVVIASAIGLLGMGPLMLGSVMSLIALILSAVSRDHYSS